MIRILVNLLVVAVPAAIGVFVFFLTPWGHDIIGKRNTIYAPSFSEAAFKRLQKGDSLGSVTAVLGDPVNRFYILRYPNQAFNSHPAVAPEQLPPGTSIHWEILQYSASKTPPSDFRLVEIIANPDGTVFDKRDFVTD